MTSGSLPGPECTEEIILPHLDLYGFQKCRFRVYEKESETGEPERFRHGRGSGSSQPDVPYVTVFSETQWRYTVSYSISPAVEEVFLPKDTWELYPDALGEMMPVECLYLNKMHCRVCCQSGALSKTFRISHSVKAPYWHSSPGQELHPCQCGLLIWAISSA